MKKSALEGSNRLEVVGKRSGQIATTIENAQVLFETVRELRKGDGVCPKGIYRFRSFEEADAWMIKMIARSVRGSRP